MNPHEALIQLGNMLHGKFFDPSAFLVLNSALISDLLRQVRLLAAGLFTVFLLLEIVRRLMGDLSGKPLSFLPLFISAGLLGAGIASPEAYFYVCNLIVSLGSVAASAIDNINVSVAGMEVQNLMWASLASTLNPVAWFMALLDMLNPLSFIAVALYWLATALLFVMPILQGVFIATFIILGPLLLPFAIFKPFARIGLVWLYSLLAASFFGVFGVIAYTAISVSGILTYIAESRSNVFLSATYSLVTILVIMCIPKTAFSLFQGTYAALSKGVSMTKRLIKVF